MREPVTQELALPGLSTTEALGSRLAALLPANPAGWMLLLEGELGSGKSTLARAMLRKFGYAGPVPSPTYTLVEPYQFDEFIVYHVDLYRISDTDELQFLGWPELRDGLLLVEWPERVEGLAGQADVNVRLRYAGEGRAARLVGLTPRGAELVAAVSVNRV